MSTVEEAIGRLKALAALDFNLAVYPYAQRDEDLAEVARLRTENADLLTQKGEARRLRDRLKGVLLHFAALEALTDACSTCEGTGVVTADRAGDEDCNISCAGPRGCDGLGRVPRATPQTQRVQICGKPHKDGPYIRVWDDDPAAVRLFESEPGQYYVHVTMVVGSGSWEETEVKP